MLAEFRAFLTKTNALALAIGVIIGAALGAVVNSLVNDIIMPPIGWALGGVNFAELKVVLGTTTDAKGVVTEVAIRYGAFINTLIVFVIVALVVDAVEEGHDRLAGEQLAQPGDRRIGGELGTVGRRERLPVHAVLVERAAQLRRRRGLFGPEVDGGALLAEAPGPEPVDEHAEAVGA